MNAGRYPTGSIGDRFDRAIRLRQLERTKKGIVWSKEQPAEMIGPANGSASKEWRPSWPNATRRL
jgi:hypothetical protein